MILDVLMGAITNAIMIMFVGLPSLPPMADSISNSVGTIITLIGDGVGFVSYIFSPPLLIFIFTVSMVILNFNFIYNTVIWVFQKIPFINIR